MNARERAVWMQWWDSPQSERWKGNVGLTGRKVADADADGADADADAAEPAAEQTAEAGS